MIPKLYGIAGIVLLFVIALGWGGCAQQQATKYKGERDKAQGELVQASAALEGKEAVVTDLRSALASWQASAERLEAAARVAGDRAEAAEAARIALAKDLRVRERANDHVPGCAEFLATDLAAVCPDRARGVRERAAASLPGQGGGEAGAGGAVHRPEIE